MTSDGPERLDRAQRQDLLGWAVLVLAGLGVTWLALRAGARLGTAAAPFLGTYDWRFAPVSLLAPAVAAGLLFAARRGWPERAPWPAVLLAGYAVTLAWTLALALVDGTAGLTRILHTSDRHPPGLRLLREALPRDDLAVAALLTAFVALLVPLVLVAVRGVCGDLPARRFLPVAALAPYAIWLVPGSDAVAAVLGAAAVAAAVHASDARRTGLRAAGWAATAGLLLGTAVLFSYSVPWLGLSGTCLYFARRRAALNLFSAAGALAPIAALQLWGHDWVAGPGPVRSALWWSVLSPVVLVLVAGPPLYASLRKLRNTPGWPFLVGAGAAVVFSLATGLARGGAELAWLPFLPWLTVAAVAPPRQAGPPVPAPLLLVAVGALGAVGLRAALRTG